MGERHSGFDAEKVYFGDKGTIPDNKKVLQEERRKYERAVTEEAMDTSREGFRPVLGQVEHIIHSDALNSNLNRALEEKQKLVKKTQRFPENTDLAARLKKAKKDVAAAYRLLADSEETSAQ